MKVLSEHDAFTLVEMMVVVGIIALLASFTIPVFNQLLNTAQVDAASGAVKNALEQARSQALMNNSVFTLEFANVTSPVGQIGVAYIDVEEPDKEAGHQVVKFEDIEDFNNEDNKIGRAHV